MNVSTLCLSILYEREATGYEIRRMSVEGEYAHFAEASYGSIYPALSRLKAEGLVTSRTVPQDGKPARKVYAITEAGRAAFIEALHEPLANDVLRSPFLLFARFAHLLPARLVRERIEAQLEKMAEARRMVENLLAESGRTEADQWVIAYGRATMEVAERHLRDHMHELVALARADETLKDAAE